MLMGTPEAPTVLGVATTLLIIDLVVVGLRFYNRKKLKQAFTVDDWLMIPSILLIIGLMSIIAYGIDSRALGYPSPLAQMQAQQNLKRQGPDRSAITEMIELLSLTAKLEYAFLCIVTPLLGLIKISVLIFYRRIFVINKRNFADARNMFFTISLILIALWATSICLAFMWMCKGDFNAAFNAPAEVEKKCIDAPLLAYAFSISDFITDTLIILIPIPFIWLLQLKLEKKLAVISILLLGILASISSLIRLLWTVWARDVGYDPSLDPELITTALLFWFIVETNIGLLAACLPTLRGLINGKGMGVFFSGIKSKMSSSYRSSQIRTKGSEVHYDSEFERSSSS